MAGNSHCKARTLTASTGLGLLVCLFFGWLSGMGATPAKPAQLWRVGYEVGISPISYSNEQGQALGFAPALLQAIAVDQGLQLEEHVKPWTELYQDFQAGRLDVLAAAAPTEDRRKTMLFSSPYMERSVTLFYGKSITQPTLKHLAELRIATIPLSQSHNYLIQKGWDKKAVLCRDTDETLKAVHEGKADAVIASRMLGFKRKEALGLTSIAVHPDNFTDLSSTLHFAVRSGDEVRLAALNRGLTRLRDRGDYGRIREQWLGPYEEKEPPLTALLPYLAPALAILVVVIIAYAEQRRLNARLKEGEERMKLALEGGELAFWDWDLSTDKLHVDERWCRLLDLDVGARCGMTRDLLSSVHEEDRVMVSKALESMSASGSPLDIIFRTALRPRWLHCKGRLLGPTVDHKRKVRRAAGTLADITERRHREAELAAIQTKLMETQRLESLGVLAGGVAHDFNNLLTVMLSNASLARYDLPMEHPGNGYLVQIELAARRAAKICEQMLACAGHTSFDIRREDLAGILEEMRSLLELTVTSQNRLSIEYAAELPTVLIDRSQIRQLLLSLVQNANEACSEGKGIVRIACEPVNIEAEDIRQWGHELKAQPGPFVCLSVSDNGSGMDADTLSKIWDPFFSTKFTGRGLGLAAVHGIVKAHRGGLHVESKAGLGSCFRVYLPTRPEAACLAS